MDVYIGFGLLSAAIVVVVCMFFDNWLKNRNTKLTELSGLQDSGPEIESIDNISISRIAYDVSAETEHSELVDLCEGHSNVEPSVENVSFNVTSRHEDMPDLSQHVKPVRDEIRKPHPKTVEKKNEVISAAHEKSKVMPANLLILSVMAKKEGRFESYDLLQAISAAGLQFGEMNIFHYYQPTPVGKIALFSLASANKPGDFDLNNIAEFSCSGLMLFMDIAQTPDPQSAFKLMLDTAERLAEDLDAALCADPLTPWTEKLSWQYHQKIMHYKTASKHDNKT